MVARSRLTLLLKIGAAVGGGILLIVAALALWVDAVATRKWAALETDVRTAVSNAKSRNPARPVLRGARMSGSAWEDYEQGFQIKFSTSLLGPFIKRFPNADRDGVAELISKHAGALTCLRQGVQRAERQYPYAWEEGGLRRTPGLLECSRFVDLAIAQARIRSEAGQVKQALELLLDAVQFCHDVGFNGVCITQAIGINLADPVVREIRDILSLNPDLAPETWREVERELAILETTLPTHAHALENESTWPSSALLKGEEESDLSFFECWRYGFSRRLVVADAHEQLLRWGRKLAKGEGLSWAEERRLDQEIAREIEDARNPLLPPGTIVVSSRQIRDERARLRLLQVAAHFLAEGEALTLADPFGEKLSIKMGGGRLTAWSVGSDGHDQQGTGGWWDRPGEDIVLHLVRKP